MSVAPTVFLVDDDAAMRESMALVLEQSDFQVRTFSAAPEFLEETSPQDPGCLVLDLRMPEMTGLELQKELAHRGYELPIIFLTGYGDIPTTVRAIRRGALDFLEKPVAPEHLIRRVRQALEDDRRRRAASASEAAIRARFRTLSSREQEVMALVARGLSNKKAARELGISPRTVENHRARAMEKMEAGSVAELVAMAALCSSEQSGPAA